MRIHQDARVVFVVLPFSSLLGRLGIAEGVGPRQGLVARRFIDGQALVCSRKGMARRRQAVVPSRSGLVDNPPWVTAKPSPMTTNSFAVINQFRSLLPLQIPSFRVNN